MSIKKRSFILAIVLGTFQSVFSLGIVWIMKEFVDIYDSDIFINDFQFISFMAIVYYLIYVLIYLISRVSNVYSMTDIRINLEKNIFAAFIWRKSENDKRNNVGDIINIFEKQVDIIENYYYQPIYNIVKNVVLILFSTVAAILTQWKIAIVGFILVAIYVPLMKSVNGSLAELQNDVLKKNKSENTQLLNMISGYHLAKNMHAESFFESKYNNEVIKAANSFKKMDIGYYYLSLVKNGIEPLLVLMVLCLGILVRTSSSIQISMGTILAMTELIPKIVSPVAMLGENISKITSIKKIKSDLDNYIKEGINGKENWISRKKDFHTFENIRLENVSFSYDKNIIFQNMNNSFEKGKRYAIVGESASGKSTLLKLITKQLTPNSGKILWNDIDYNYLNSADMINLFSIVSQNIVMFNTSIKENITLEKDFILDNYQKVISECRLNKFKKNSYIRYANDLSVGEQKRVALARAIYQNKELIILDEFTSALDEDNAEALEDMILGLPGVTIINVTHRLTKKRMSLYDDVYRIEDNRLVKVKIMDPL